MAEGGDPSWRSREVPEPEARASPLWWAYALLGLCFIGFLALVAITVPLGD